MDIGSRNIKIEPSEFKGKIYVSIREWYDADGHMLPGKKGINLNLEEWEQIVTNITAINDEIAQLKK